MITFTEQTIPRPTRIHPEDKNHPVERRTKPPPKKPRKTRTLPDPGRHKLRNWFSNEPYKNWFEIRTDPGEIKFKVFNYHVHGPTPEFIGGGSTLKLAYKFVENYVKKNNL